MAPAGRHGGALDRLAEALVADGKTDDAKPFFDAAARLAPDADFANKVTVSGATLTGDTKVLLDPKSPVNQ